MVTQGTIIAIPLKTETLYNNLVRETQLRYFPSPLSNNFIEFKYYTSLSLSKVYAHFYCNIYYLLLFLLLMVELTLYSSGFTGGKLTVINNIIDL